MIAAVFLRCSLAVVLVLTETERTPCLMGFAGIVVAAVRQNTSKESIFKMH